MAAPLLFSAIMMNTAAHIPHGLWRRPDAQQVQFHSRRLSAGGNSARSLNVSGVKTACSVISRHRFYVTCNSTAAGDTVVKRPG